MKKIIAPIIVISLLLTASIATVNASVHHDEKQSQPCGSASPYTGEDNEIILTFFFDTPVITEIKRDDGSIYDQVMIEGLPIADNTGVPLLPVKPVNVLLPQRAKVESITVTKDDTIILGNRFNVELGTKPAIMNAVSYDKPDETTIKFDPMFPYPNVDFENVGIYNFRGYRVLTLILYPVHYIGENGEIYYYDEMTLTIKTFETDSVNPLFRGSPKDEMMMREMVTDYRMSETYIESTTVALQEYPVCSSESYDYVIITNEELKNASGSYTYQDLIQYKIDNGISATIITVEEIYEQFEGTDNPEKIRNFIKDAYLNWGTEYVLLGGDDDVIPVRLLWADSDPEYKITTNITSDLYYSCLDDTFNSDGDELWGEPDDGPNGEDVDLIAEVYVGRACVDNGSEVSNFVMKTLAYEQTPVDDPYLRKALMVGSYLGFGGIAEYGGNYLDEMINGSDAHRYSTVGIPYEEYQIDTLYDRDWPSWPTSELLNRINAGVNIIDHLGHGRTSGWWEDTWNSKIVNGDVFLLENTNYTFIYSQACYVGKFDECDCFAEYLTVKSSHGAFATIMNSRYGWGKFNSTDGPSQRFAREFFDAIFNEGVRDPIKTRLGVANQDSKEDNLWRINEPCMRWCYYELNLFGDPQISLKPVPVSNHDIAVDPIELSENINPYEDFDIVVTIVNQGLNDETDISGEISIFEVIDTLNYEDNLIYEYPCNINYLTSGDETTISFTYSLPRGLYRIRVHVNPVPNEDIIFNNNMTTGIFIGENNPPEKPAKPSGPTNGKAGEEYTYSTYTNDPEGDQVYYMWCWGRDPQFQYIEYFSDWLGRYDSGETIYTSNIWNYAGRYEVKVRAKDIYGALSEWSDPLSISMPVNLESTQQIIISSKQSTTTSSSQILQSVVKTTK